MALVPRATHQEMARPSRRAGQHRAGGLSVGEPVLEILLPRRLRPGSHDGDDHSYEGGELISSIGVYYRVLRLTNRT